MSVSDKIFTFLQAIECILANVTPLEGETGFSDHALAELEEIANGKVGFLHFNVSLL